MVQGLEFGAKSLGLRESFGFRIQGSGFGATVLDSLRPLVTLRRVLEPGVGDVGMLQPKEYAN